MPNTAKQKREWFRTVTNKADISTPGADAEIFVYGDIGETYWSEGVSAQSFVDTIAGIDAAELAIRVNSPGGSAWDGMTIANAIMRYEGHTTCYIDGLAASAASVVAFAGDEVVTSKYARGMLHNAAALVVGKASDMREVADQLDGLNASMASYYADRAGPDGDDATAFAAAMDAETWYSADDMLAAGLVTRIDTSGVREEVEKAAASAVAITAETYRSGGIPATCGPVATTKEIRMADKKTLAESLGLAADATEDEIIAATRTALGIKDDDDTTKTDDPAPVADPAPVVAAPVPEPVPVAKTAADGTVVVDAVAFADLQRQAAMGAQAFADAQAKADDAVVEKAIDEGRIPVARKNHYLALMKADRADTTDMLTNRLAKEAAVPLHEVGHSADVTPVASIAEDPRYKTFTKGLI